MLKVKKIMVQRRRLGPLVEHSADFGIIGGVQDFVAKVDDMHDPPTSRDKCDNV